MLALWIIGSAVEQSHGSLAAALLFILPAIGGTLLSALYLSEYITVGASGGKMKTFSNCFLQYKSRLQKVRELTHYFHLSAVVLGIFGLIGACLADIFSNWGLLFSKHVNKENEKQRFRHIYILIWLILDIMLNIVIGLTPFVDNFSHMGGVILGFLCGLSTMERLPKSFFGIERSCFSRVQTFSVRFLGIIISVLCIIAGFIVLASMHSGSIVKCRGCRYFSCVPFPFWRTENKWW